MKTKVVKDDNCLAQQMLAEATGRYCQQKCYGQSLAEIKKRLASDNSDMKRAVVERLRIWTSRVYFKGAC